MGGMIKKFSALLDVLSHKTQIIYHTTDYKCNSTEKPASSIPLKHVPPKAKKKKVKR